MKITGLERFLVVTACVLLVCGIALVAKAAEGSPRETKHYTLQDTTDGELNVTYTGESTLQEEEGPRYGRKIPVLYIDTEDGRKITSRDEYKGATLTIDNSCGLRVQNGTAGSLGMSDTLIATADAVTSYAIDIRGRGNASWLSFPQKSYQIRFEDKLSLFGMTRSRKYVLQPGYIDPSLIRNYVAMTMATALTNFEYVVSNLPVEVFLNGSYIGVYSLSEKIEEGIEKVNLFSEYSYDELQEMGETKTPFILECGPYSQGKVTYDEMSYVEGLDYILVTGNERLLMRYPEITQTYSPEVYEISDQINAMGLQICIGRDYEKYLDLPEWVDWFLMIELTGNTDSAIHRSTYFYRRPGGLVQIGPVWDFDTAFGKDANDAKNHDRWTSTETRLVAKKYTWMVRLYQGDSFMLAARERWDEVKDEMMARAREAVAYYGDLVEDTYEDHNRLYRTKAGREEAQKILDYLEARYQWIDESIHRDDFNRQPYVAESNKTDETQ